MKKILITTDGKGQKEQKKDYIYESVGIHRGLYI
jgi:hypothetical protein